MRWSIRQQRLRDLADVPIRVPDGDSGQDEAAPTERGESRAVMQQDADDLAPDSAGTEHRDPERRPVVHGIVMQADDIAGMVAAARGDRRLGAADARESSEPMGGPARRGRPLHSATMTAQLPTAADPSTPHGTAPRIFSGIQPSGAPHIGNDLGAIRNYVALQSRYEAIYCIVDFHALTSVHDPDRMRQQTLEMASALLALGLDPDRCTLFVQSHRPEVTELAWLLMTVTPVSWLERTPTYKEKKQNQPEDINHGLLTYPVLQAADIVIYKASLVPVGKDQAAHLELSREIVRAFNQRYGDTFPEPQAVFTEAPVVLGTDGVRKMSKSMGNTIEVFAEPDQIRRQITSMVTDTERIKRSDPGRPEICNVCQLHRFFGDDHQAIWDGERSARTGCVDTKKLLAERIIAHYAPARERYLDLMAHPGTVDEILRAGAERIRPIAEATMAEVREKMGLR